MTQKKKMDYGNELVICDFLLEKNIVIMLS